MGNTAFRFGKEKISDAPSDMFKLNALAVDGTEFEFSLLSKKKWILIVNVASNCELAQRNILQLNELYEGFEKNGLEILAFISNQFAGPFFTTERISQSLYSRFKIKFPLFANIFVNGDKSHPLYKYLKSKCLELQDPDTGLYKEIPWNFAKFLLDSNGEVISYLSPMDEPRNFIKILEAGLPN